MTSLTRLTPLSMSVSPERQVIGTRAPPGRTHQPPADMVRPRNLQHLAVEACELSPQSSPRPPHGANHRLELLPHLEAEAAQDASDGEFHVEQLGLQ